eukprot:6184778-Pleurochrysis_carterae.AAC.5
MHLLGDHPGAKADIPIVKSCKLSRREALVSRAQLNANARATLVHRDKRIVHLCAMPHLDLRRDARAHKLALTYVEDEIDGGVG